MNTSELMQGDWVRLSTAPIFCRVCGFTEDSKVLGRTAGGGAFIKDSDQLSPIDLTQDSILCTPFWLVRKGVFKKTVRNVAVFVYEVEKRKLVVQSLWSDFVNTHYIAFMHELQHLYHHYACAPLEVDMAHSKRKEYSKKYNSRKGGRHE